MTISTSAFGEPGKIEKLRYITVLISLCTTFAFNSALSVSMRRYVAQPSPVALCIYGSIQQRMVVELPVSDELQLRLRSPSRQPGR
jgi:hypothetical protein